MTREKYTNKVGKTRYRPVMSEKTAWRAQDDGTGWCLVCGKAVHGVEPDARKYTCETCNEPTVYGIAELFVMGLARLK